MDWSDLLAALALVLIFEGVLPFANPRGTRRALAQVSRLDDRTLRTAGLVSMLLGLIFLYLVRF